VHVQFGGRVLVDGLEEPQEFLVAVLALALADDLAGLPVPTREPGVRVIPAPGSPRVPNGLADEFRDLADERHVIMAGTTETSPRRIDHIDVEWRNDLRSAVAIPFDTYLRRVARRQDHRGGAVRGGQRVLALAAAIWHNNKTGAPITRSLIAYDH
jgi:hypothetical protein